MKEIILEQNGFKVRIIDDDQYITQSNENNIHYHHQYGESALFQPSSRHGVIVSKDEVEISSAIILGFVGTTIHNTSFVMEKERLYICVSNRIVCLSFPELKLFWDK